MTVQPFRCFDTRALFISLAVAAWLLVTAWLGRDYAQNSAPRLLFALGQGAAIVGFAWALARSIGRLDELEQRIHYQALSIAAALVITAIASWSFFEKAGLPSIDWSLFAMPAFVAAWALGVMRISRRFR